MKLSLIEKTQLAMACVFLYASLWMALLFRDQEMLAKTVSIFANELDDGLYNLPFLTVCLEDTSYGRMCVINGMHRVLSTYL